MKHLTNYFLSAVIGATLFSACSRPVATFQPSKVERYYSKATPVADAGQPVTDADTMLETSHVADQQQVTPNPSAAAIQNFREQLSGAVASNKAQLADKRVQSRMLRVDKLLAAAQQRASANPGAVGSTKKLSLTERVLLKKLDRRIKKHTASEQIKDTSLNKLTIAGIVLTGLGLIIAVAISGGIGLILLLIGIVLLLLGLLQ